MSYNRSSLLTNAAKTHCFKAALIFFFSLSYFFFSAGGQIVKLDNQFKVMCVALHPSSPDVFLCGGYSSMVKAWDSRCSKVKVINLPPVYHFY